MVRPGNQPVGVFGMNASWKCEASGDRTDKLALRPREAARRAERREQRARDKRLYDLWQTGRYATFAALADAEGLSKRDVKRAIDRQRKRISSAGRTAPHKTSGK